MIKSEQFLNFDKEWRNANAEYLTHKANNMNETDLQYYRSIALLRAQIRAVAYLHNIAVN
jgi:hypothetical protein